jgi:hypothetical protein
MMQLAIDQVGFVSVLETDNPEVVKIGAERRKQLETMFPGKEYKMTNDRWAPWIVVVSREEALIKIRKGLCGVK